MKLINFKRKPLIIVTIVFLILSLVLFNYFFQKKLLLQYLYWIPEKHVEAKLINNGDAIVATEKYDKSEISEIEEAQKNNYDLDVNTFQIENSYNYLVTVKARLKERPYVKKLPNEEDLPLLQRDRAEFGEYWKLVVYKAHQNKIRKIEYDIFELVRTYNKKNHVDFVPSILMNRSMQYRGTKGFISMAIRKKGTIDNDNIRDVLIDLDNGRIVDVESEDLFDQTYSLPFVDYTSLKNLIEKQGIIVNGNHVFVDDESSGKTVQDWSMNKKESEIVNEFKEGKNSRDGIFSVRPRTTIFINQSMEDIDKSVRVLKLFFPENKNIFDDVTIPAEHSKDHQTHTVHSLEEFKTFYSGVTNQ